MSAKPQFAMHPDAEQLAAFAEQALPAHEREQTLAHLAVCGACRQVVFLAQEATPLEVIPAAVAPARRRWFAGWAIVWPVAALAGMVAFTVHLRMAGRAADQAPARVTMADAVTVTAAPVEVATESAEVAVTKKPLAPGGGNAVTPPRQRKAPASSAAAAGEPGDGFTGGQLPAARPATLGQGLGYAASSGQSGPMQQQQYLAPNVAPNVAPKQNAAAAMPVPLPKIAVGQLPLNGRNTVTLATPMAAPPAPPAAVPAQTSVQVSGAAAMSLNGHGLDALSDDAKSNDAKSIDENSELMALQPVMLPSRLAAVSTVTRGTRSVAIDSRGGVFLTTDGGGHWKQVKGGWGGRVVTVSAAGSAAPPEFRAALAGKIATAKQPASSRDRADVQGVVTDAVGAVVARATIRMSLQAGGDVATTRSLNSGQFAVEGLAPGEYRMEITAPGFADYVSLMTLTAGERESLRVVLTIGAMSQTVTVSAETVETKAKKVAPAAVFALTTDAGVVWVSVDGKKWKRQ